MKIPPIPTQVVEYLEDTFLDTLPNDVVTVESIHVRIGQQQVIRKLRLEMERQQKNIMESL